MGYSLPPYIIIERQQARLDKLQTEGDLLRQVVQGLQQSADLRDELITKQGDRIQSLTRILVAVNSYAAITGDGALLDLIINVGIKERIINDEPK